MVEILLVIIIVILSIISYRVDSHLRVIINKPKKVSSEAAVTRGTYAPIVESNSGDIGISEPKTPQLIEFEAGQELLRRNQSL